MHGNVSLLVFLVLGATFSISATLHIIFLYWRWPLPNIWH